MNKFISLLIIFVIICISGCGAGTPDETYHITYDANGGEFCLYDYPSCFGGEFKYWDYFGYYPTPVKTGSAFTGWNTKPDGSGVTHTDSPMPPSGSVLYAQWTSSACINGMCTVKFNPYNGMVSPADMTVPAGTDISLPVHIRFDIYNLSGWTVGPIIYTDIYKVTENTLLTAYWEHSTLDGLTCTVTFDAGGGMLDDPVLAIQQIPCNTTVSLPSAAKAGSVLSGWKYVYTHGEKIYHYPGNVFLFQNITLQAVWQ